MISGFRLGFGGYAGSSGIRPDLVTYGKVIGGGFPVGAYGGRRDLMELVAPAGPVYQAGTLSANPLAMCAGLATLQRLARRHALSAARSSSARGWSARCTACRTWRVQRVGSIFWICISQHGTPATPMRALQQLSRRCRPRASRPLFHALLERGIYLAPSAFEVGFLSAAHTEAHIDTLARRCAARCS